MKPPNFYAANGLDRAGHRRREPDWLSQQLAHRETLFVPVWRGQNLVAGIAEGVPTAMLVRREALVSLEGEAVLLGLREARAYFALDLSDREAPLETIRTEGPVEFADLRRVGPLLARPDGALLAYARGIVHWHGRHRFCGVCGNPTRSEEGGHVRRCISPA
ncbi:MAG TPA: NUDIX-like domain-containing protein, partial [Stellaceae bacterium]|nr:NUDIX-like domain-containing protein [Stellaceae bacterium]